LVSEDEKARDLMKNIEEILDNVNMDKQYRDKTRKLRFNLEWAFLLGHTTGALGSGGFHTPHNISSKKGKGVCVTPVEDRKLPKWKQRLWRLSNELISMVDKDFAEGEYVVNYSKMTTGDHYVRKHVDKDDVSFQYALALGDYTGAALRCYDKNDNVIGDYDYHNKILKMDGRLPHEVILDDFQGNRYCVIWFKSYDHRKPEVDPIYNTPHYV